MDIHEGIDNTLLILEDRLKQQSKLSDIQVIKNSGGLPLVECCPGQLNQVFMNIITNAIDAIEESFVRGHLSSEKDSGKIEICTEIVESNLIVIRIADNGFGIKT